MMKKFVFPAVILFQLVALPGLFAAEISPEAGPVRKLQRGVVNIALSPIEIAQELHAAKSVDSAIPSWVGGAVKGTIFMMGRALSGVYDLVTFPIPAPANYESLVSPEFAWEHLPATPAEKAV